MAFPPTIDDLKIRIDEYANSHSKRHLYLEIHQRNKRGEIISYINNTYPHLEAKSSICKEYHHPDSDLVVCMCGKVKPFSMLTWSHNGKDMNTYCVRCLEDMYTTDVLGRLPYIVVTGKNCVIVKKRT